MVSESKINGVYTMGLSKVQAAELADRRRIVAGMHLRRKTQAEIATELNVDPRTIQRDVAWLERLWQKELVTDPVKQRARDLAATNNLERSAAKRYLETGSEVWWDRIMKSLERRAKLLGLDHKDTMPGSSPATPLYDAPGHIDWDNLPEDLAEEFISINERILAAQPESGGLIVNGEAKVVE